MSLLDTKLKAHSSKSVHLVTAAIRRAQQRGLVAPGIDDANSKEVFAMQLIESIRRVQFVVGLGDRSIDARRADPSTKLFDPIRGAAYLRSQGNIDEASWLVFLSTHFGQRPATNWALVSAFYRGDKNGPWTWTRATENLTHLLKWLNANAEFLRESGRFGNHRKYESLGAYSSNGTGSALSSYIEWVKSYGSHEQLFAQASLLTEHDRGLCFAHLYREMASVRRFGRMAKFDYLCMLAKLDLANIWPNSMYVAESTGPKRGGKLLLGDQASATDIEDAIDLLDSEMDVGMQVFEDALCNWQKSPDVFVRFRG